MKKLLVMIVASLIVITSLTGISATCEEIDIEDGSMIIFNGEALDYTSVTYNNTHYVPMRKIFEKMGAAVFYRNSDHQVLALSRDGDIIRHIVGDNKISISGKELVFENPSVLKNSETFLPAEMISAVFSTDEIIYDNQQLNIQKHFSENKYHQIIKDVLDVCRKSSFCPENFQRYIKYHSKMPAYSMSEVLFRVNLGLDYPFYENVEIIKQPYEYLTLVNKYNMLPPGFSQQNLVAMSKEHTARDGKQYLLEAKAYEKYVQMSDAAKEDGIFMRVVSAYRTEDYQRNLYNKRAVSTGANNTDKYTARPGFSEHQLGLAVDINSTLNSFEGTAAFKWLQNHAHEYGYILRYPKGKEWITGYAYEPWHYRYVGYDAARIIYEEGITYEEYYAKYLSANQFK